MPAQRKPRAADRSSSSSSSSRKHGGSSRASRIVPTTPEACASAMSSKACLLPPMELKRCKFITPQTGNPIQISLSLGLRYSFLECVVVYRYVCA
jgi:hypothetical protein